MAVIALESSPVAVRHCFETGKQLGLSPEIVQKILKSNIKLFKTRSAEILAISFY
jgi:hypothetical protein